MFKRLLSSHHLTTILPVFLLCVLLGLWLGIDALIKHDKKISLAHQQEIDRNLVRALEEHIDSVIREVDQTTRFLKFRYEQTPEQVDIVSFLEQEVIINRYFTQIGIVDEHGFLTMTNKRDFKRVDLRDREHFLVHKQAQDRGLFISKPILGRSSGKWSIQFTRRINKANGDFGGVVVVSVDPFYFTQLYQDVHTSHNGVILLVGLDGIIRTAKSGDFLKMGENISHHPWFQLLKNQHNQFVQKQFTGYGNHTWQLSATTLDKFPISVVLMHKDSSILQEHEERQEYLILLGGFSSLFLLLFGGYILWQAHRLQRSQAAAKSANKMKSEFLAHMSHELRTPLNGILGAAELIQESEQVEECRELAVMIYSSGKQLHQHVDMVLDLARLEAGKMTLQTKPYQLATILQQACNQHQHFARQKNLALECVWDGELLGSAEVDHVRLGEIISNLLHNAIKYTPQGKVTVEATRQPHHVIIKVTDTGIGIHEEDLPYIFDKFRQVERFVTRSQGGSGLGLALVRELSCLMGGNIQVQSTPNQGSCFILELPLEDIFHDKKPIYSNR